MQASATLKAGQWWAPTYQSMKSTTLPSRTRSIRLPSAPEITSASGSAVRQSRRGVRRSHSVIPALITTARPAKIHFCQPPASARKLNAAP